MNEKNLLSADQKEQGSSADRIIELKAVHKTKHTVQPAFDKATNWWAGIPRLSDEDKRGMNYFTTPESKLTLENGMIFDLNKEVDAENWKWVKHLKEVALSHEDAQMTPSAMFYVHIEGREARKSNTKKYLKYEATKFVMEESPVNYENRALLLGVDMEGENPEVIKEFLLEKAEKEPTAVLTVFKSNTLAIQLLFLKAKKKGVITTNESGVLTYGTQVLGVTDEGAIAFLQEKSNKNILDLLEREVNPEFYNEKMEKVEEDLDDSKE